MSDSEDAFESADEGGEEKKELENKEKVASPEFKTPAENLPSPATGDDGSAQKGKKAKGKRRKGKGARPRGHSEPSDNSDKELGATSELTSENVNADLKQKSADMVGEQKVELDKIASEQEVSTEADESSKRENEDIVDKMSDLHIERDVPDDANREEKDDNKTEESKGKRDVTPTRKVERRNKEEVLDKLSGAAEKQKDTGGSWGWGSWGSSILSTATKSVTTFTSQVGEGFSTVLETVESSLGAPTAEEVAKQQRAVHTAKEPSENGAPDSNPASDEEEEGVAGAVGGQEKDKKETEKESDDNNPKEEDESAGWFASWGLPSGISKVVENTTKAVESTGKNLVVGGLDVLENIGKKTYDVLAEGELGLKNTLKNSGAKPNLSQMLREAKEEADEKAKQNEEYEEARKAHFGALFDDFSGLAHLEGLEMVSNQCEGKVQSLLGSMPSDAVTQIKPDLINIKEEFNLEQHEDDEAEDEVKEHEFKQLVTEHIGNLGLNVTPDKLIQVQGRGRHWLHDTAEEQTKGVRVSAKEIHQMGIQSLAELTACSVENFHKMAQLLQVNQPLPINTYKFKASNLKILTLVLGTEVDILSSKFTECLNTAADDSEEPDSVNPFITNIYLEASNSKTYIQDAFQLLLPILQHAALKSHASS